MKGIILKQDEVRTLQDAGGVTIWRDINPQPQKDGDNWTFNGELFVWEESLKSHLFHDYYGNNGTPYGSVYTDGSCETRYVKETWRPWSWHEGERWVFQYKDLRRMEARSVDMSDEYKQEEWEISEWIKISDELSEAGYKPGDDDLYHFGGDPPLKWRPSVHMPQWASRYTVKCTAVTVEKRGAWQWGIELEKVQV